MDLKVWLVCLGCGWWGLPTCTAHTTVTPAEIGAQLGRRHLLVKFKSDIRSSLDRTPWTNGLSALLAKLSFPAGTELTEPRISTLLREQGTGNPSQASAQAPDLDRFLYLRLPAGLAVEQALQMLKGLPGVEYAEPDGIGTGGTTIPNDPDFECQWHHQNPVKPTACIHTPEAWDVTRGSSNVLVAVLDTGLGTGLPEFEGRSVPGYNFVDGTTNTADRHGHGTAVAGVLCANADNSRLVAGVDWNCRLLPVKVMDDRNVGYYSWWAQGIDFAVSRGCKVVNLSAGGTATNITLTRSISNAIAQGVVFVTISHNDGHGTIRFPGRLLECITVGATDRTDARAEFSNYGPELDLVAPGVEICTTGLSGGLKEESGTSFSAPQVSGVCALLAAVLPSLNQENAKLLLCAGAEDGTGDAKDTVGFDPYYGWGRLNAYNSLLLAKTRIEEIHVTGQNIAISWTSPSNASNKRPYQVEFSASLTDPAWKPMDSASVFSFDNTRTHWNDDISTTDFPNGFFRVRIREP